jgi:type IV pilus assembly protein PilB
MALRVTEDELRTLLVKKLEVIDTTEFERARAAAARLRVPLERALVERTRIPFAFLLEQLAETWGVEFIDLNVGDVDRAVLTAVSEEYARAHLVMPFAQADRCLRVAMWDPRDRHVIREIESMTGLEIAPCLAPARAIQRAQLLYRADFRDMLDRGASEATLSLRDSARADAAEGVGAARLTERLLEYAAAVGASDIHIEPHELEVLVRYRIDGVLHDRLSLPPEALAGIVTRIKILSDMRIDERRAPQDGRFETKVGGGLGLDLRVSSLPTLWGEKVVLRVLSKETASLDLDELGLSRADLEIFLRNVLRPFGMILITGPTGSGKTTTLYAMLMRLGAERHNLVNISTVEDPIEYTIPRVTQMPINPTAGVDFATGLRALLRQDPDIIMVGEIRDSETAEIAVRAALVGRLVFSPLHTNDSTAAIPRLLDMGVEPYLVASTASLVVAQRLVRRLCPLCRESVVAEPAVVRTLRARSDFDQTIRVLQEHAVLGGGTDPLAGMRLFHGRGCAQCQNTGFRGRLGLFELFEVDDQIRAMIMDRQNTSAIRAFALSRGMKTMFQDGLAKVILGETSLTEVLRAAV